MNGRILAVLLVVLGLSVAPSTSKPVMGISGRGPAKGTEGQIACQEKGYMEMEAFSKAVNCAAGQSCVTFTAYKGPMKLYKKGCLAADECKNPPKAETMATMSYTVNTACCSTNLCNRD